MDDDDDMDVEDMEVALPSYEYSQNLATSDLLAFAAAQAALTAEYMTLVATRHGADHNHRVDKASFATEAALDIETIMKGE